MENRFRHENDFTDDMFKTGSKFYGTGKEFNLKFSDLKPI